MANMEFKIPHQLSKQDAVTRIKGLLAETKKEHGDKISNLKESWTDDKANFSFTAMGFDVSGEMQVNDNNVDFKGKLPIALSFFKGKIESLIRDKASALLSK